MELFGPDGLPAGPVKLVGGQILVVHLSEQAGSTGYSWSATVRGGGLVKDGDAVSAPTSSKSRGGVPMVGAPGDHAFTFRAQGSGAARLVFTLKRPFQGEPAKTVSLSVIVVAPSPAPHSNPAPNPNPGPHSNPAPSPNPGPGPNPAPNADPGPGPSLPHGMAPDPAGLTVEVDGPEKLPTTPVALKAGQKLVVHLREPGSSGFSWSTSVPANLTLLDMDLVAGVGTPGTPGQHNFTFLAARSGDGKIEFVLRHPWVGGETAQRVELAVTVR